MCIAHAIFVAENAFVFISHIIILFHHIWAERSLNWICEQSHWDTYFNFIHSADRFSTKIMSRKFKCLNITEHKLISIEFFSSFISFFVLILFHSASIVISVLICSQIISLLLLYSEIYIALIATIWFIHTYSNNLVFPLKIMDSMDTKIKKKATYCELLKKINNFFFCNLILFSFCNPSFVCFLLLLWYLQSDCYIILVWAFITALYIIRSHTELIQFYFSLKPMRFCISCMCLYRVYVLFHLAN